MRREILLALGLLISVSTMAYGQQQTCVFPRQDKVNADVKAKVSQSKTGFDYRYLVENRPSAQQTLISFAVQAFRGDGTLPVQISPPTWEAGGPIADSSFYVWDTFQQPRGLRAGRSAAGFGFADMGLPAIVTFLAWGDVEPPSFPEGQAPDTCEGDDVIENSFKGPTVGPKPPPQNFVAIEFLNYLITLLHDSRQAGWIKVDGVHQSLLAKLKEAKRKLESADSKVAKNVLDAFLHEVRATSCQEFACPGNKPLTSEAYALLFFNGQFLSDRLP